MKYKLLVWIMAIVLFSSFVSGEVLFSDTGDISYNNATPNNDDLMTTVGGWTPQIMGTGGSMIYSNAETYEGELSMKITSGTSEGIHVNTSDLETIFTIDFMMKSLDTNDDGWGYAVRTDGTGNIGFGLRDASTNGKFSGYDYWDGGTNYDTNLTLDTDWHRFFYMWSPTGVIISEGTIDNHIYTHTHATGGAKGFYLQSDKETFYIDNYFVCDTIGECYNNSMSVSYDTINLSTLYPATDSQFKNDSINFNVTGNFTYTTNCSLYINDSINATIEGYSSGTDVQVVFNETFDNGEYAYYINCIDNTTNESTASKTILVDDINPYLVSNFVNNSVYFDENITGQINFSDDVGLWSYNISINGVTFENKSNLLVPLYVYNFSLNTNDSLFDIGSNEVVFDVYDGHTRKELKGDYDIGTGWFNDVVRFDMGEVYDELWIKETPEDGSWFDSWKVEKKLDRYVQTYTPSKPKKTQVFFLESSESISIVKDPTNKYGYHGDWVIIGEHWKDWNLPLEPTSHVEVQRINSKKVKVVVSNIMNPKVQNYNSIGDLNTYSLTYNLEIANITTTYETPIFQKQDHDIQAEVNKTANVDSSLVLSYNGTNQTFTETETATLDSYIANLVASDVDSEAIVEMIVYYILNSSGSSTSGNISFNQTILPIGVDNCTTYSDEAIKFELIDQTDDQGVNGSLDGFFEIWFPGDSINNKPFNLTWNDLSTNKSVCISNASLELQLYSQMEYSVGSFTGTYYISNLSVDNTTQNINLYVPASSTEVTFNVVDDDDNAVEDVFIYVQAYDLPTDSYITQEIIKTGSDGNAIGNIILNTQWYKFILYYEDEIRLETSPLKITSTSYTFRISLEDDYFDTFSEAQGVDCDLDFDNTSKVFTLTWVDSSESSEQVCLVLSEFSVGSYGEINSSCDSSASGSLNLYLPGDFDGNRYGAQGFVYIEGESFMCDDSEASFVNRYKEYGLEGLFMAFLLILALILLGLWNPFAAIAFLIVGLIVATLSGLMELNYGILISLIIIGIIVLLRLAKK